MAEGVEVEEGAGTSHVLITLAAAAAAPKRRRHAAAEEVSGAPAEEVRGSRLIHCPRCGHGNSRSAERCWAKKLYSSGRRSDIERDCCGAWLRAAAAAAPPAAAVDGGIGVE